MNGHNILITSKPRIILELRTMSNFKNWWWLRRTYPLLWGDWSDREIWPKKPKPDMSSISTLCVLKNIWRNLMIKFWDWNVLIANFMYSWVKLSLKTSKNTTRILRIYRYCIIENSCKIYGWRENGLIRFSDYYFSRRSSKKMKLISKTSSLILFTNSNKIGLTKNIWKYFKCSSNSMKPKWILSRFSKSDSYMKVLAFSIKHRKFITESGNWPYTVGVSCFVYSPSNICFVNLSSNNWKAINGFQLTTVISGRLPTKRLLLIYV